MDETVIELLTKISDKLDDIAEGIGDINAKLAQSSQLLTRLDAMQEWLNEIPNEIVAGLTPPISRR